MPEYSLRQAINEDMPAMAFVELVSAKRFIGTLEGLDVLPAHGRRGLGARLVRAVCE